MPSAARYFALLLPVAIVLAALIANPAAASAAAPGKRIEREIKQVRAGAGLPAVRSSRSLRRSSRAFAGYLMRSGRFAHGRRIRMSRRFRLRGEALAICSRGACGARRTVRSWLASPPHRRLLLSRSFSWIGVGTVAGRFNGAPARIAVLHAGRR